MKRLSGAKRILSILFALILSITLLPISAAAAEPNGWWPIWKAYSDAANAENPDVETIIRTGQAVLDFYSQYPLEVSYAEKMTLVCQKRLELLYFENKGDYDAAVDNTAMLRDLTDYLVQNGRDLNDLYIRAVDHLELLEPIIGVLPSRIRSTATMTPRSFPSPARSTAASIRAIWRATARVRAASPLSMWSLATRPPRSSTI